MTEQQRQRLRNIKTFPQLIAFLRDELDWPIEQGHDEDDLTFDWSDDLGLKESERVGIKEIKQLRPLETSQPWGIFFVNFEKKQLPIVILRRILNALVMKKRAGANKAQQAAWQQHDLLFISAYGEDTDRQLTFAHFSEPAAEEDAAKATLRVLGWDDDDTNLKLDYVADQLKSSLTWPADPSDVPAWRKRWSAAFELRYRQVIDTAEELALHLAELAKRIRNRMLLVLPRESESGELRKLLKGFKTALIHDLDEKQFADMYAQTITYGLFSAAVSRTVPGAGTAVVQGNVVDMVPVTNPFLKEMLGSFLKAGGRKNKLDFDELGIQEVVDLLNDKKTNLEAVLRDFGNKTRGEDPVIHFYEKFLAAYDKKLKVQRGVFYTPQPVVSYIVRSVHELLQTEFGLEDGLADITTWGEILKRHPGIKLPNLTDEPGEKRTISPDEFFVQILDPATGTATFLVEVMDVIHRHMTAKWKKQGFNKAARDTAWNDYVPKHLLPRVHAFELMMAPYAIAHMKIGLKLSETGYRFGSEKRARIYLTNALEPWQRQLQLPEFEALAQEATAVNEIKRCKRFTIVIGNPPYSNFGQLNRTDFVLGLLDDYKRGLNEKKLNLDDDFIKFVRFGQHVIQQSGCGALALITNNVFLDGITHRQMRRALRESFATIRILDLHGSARKLETGRDGGEENVFEIQQGVAVGIFSQPADNAKSSLFHADLWGTRDSKYQELDKTSIHSTILTPIESPAPYWFFVPKMFETGDDFQSYPGLKEMFITSGNAIKTERDRVSIHFTPEDAKAVVEAFRSKDEAFLRREYDLEMDSRDWKVSNAKADVCGNRSEKLFRPILYRPFDIRHTWYSGQTRGFVGTPAYPTMKHLVAGSNMAMACLRQTRRSETGTYLVGRGLIGKDIVSIFDIGTVFPLYLYDESLSFDLGSKELGVEQPTNRLPNFSKRFLKVLATALQRPEQGPYGLPAGLTPEDIFHYAYAMFHCPTYRSRYAEFLKIDFPRLPLTSNLDLFRALAQLGGELIALHLLESTRLDHPLTEFIGSNKDVAKVGYSDDTVWIDASGTKGKSKPGTSGFRGVPTAVWNFHIGGYQVCEKWLKDRKGRTLSADDIRHYHRIVVAISETIRLMAEIDVVINQYGGWPGAFASAAPVADTPVVHYVTDGVPDSAEEAWTIGLVWHLLREAGPLQQADLREILAWRQNPLPDDIPEADARSAWGVVRPVIEKRMNAQASARLDLMLDYLVRRGLIRRQGAALAALDGDLPPEIVADADTATVAPLLPKVLQGMPEPVAAPGQADRPDEKRA